MDWKNNKAIYLQVMERFKQDVVNGVYQLGNKVPSVRELALHLGINPNTIVKVYDLLTEEGLIEAKGTTGFFLTEDAKVIKKLKSEIVKMHCQEFLDSMTGLGYSKQEVIELLKESE